MSSSRVWVVAFEFSPFPGGQGTYASEIVAALRKAGREVMVICPEYGNQPSYSDPEYGALRVLSHQKLGLSSFCKVAAALVAIKPSDIILACDIRAAIITSLIPWINSSKRVVMFHGGEVLHAENGYIGKLAVRLAAGRYSKLVANSSYSARLVIKHVRRYCDSIPLGASLYWSESVAGEFENSELNAICSGDQVICMVGRLEKRKGHLIALEAVKLLEKRRSSGWRFVIAGRVEDNAYAAQVKDLSDTIEHSLYVGQLSKDDVRKLYARSSVLFLPAQSEKNHIEGFGLVFIEAAAQGCPSISTRIGGIPDAVIDGVTGYLIDDERDVERMSELMDEILNDKIKRKKMSGDAKAFASTMSWSRIAELTLNEVDD